LRTFSSTVSHTVPSAPVVTPTSSPVATSGFVNSHSNIYVDVRRNRSTCFKARSNHKIKCWKVRQSISSCVLGKDIDMDRVSSLSKKALIGKFFYSSLTKAQLSNWIMGFWKLVLGYSPRFRLLSNHWYIFHFLTKEDLMKILNSSWIINRGVLMLKRWVLGFDPLIETFSKRFLWMLLLDFPVEFWSKHIFVAVANYVRKFIFFDERSLCWVNKQVVWVLVELDLDRGLLEYIEVTIGGYSFCEFVDLCREPFRYHLCWQTGHLKASCLWISLQNL